MTKTTSVFKSGNSLVVRLPKGFTLPIGRVEIEEDDGKIILTSPANGWPADLRETFPPDCPAADAWERPEQGETPEVLSW